MVRAPILKVKGLSKSFGNKLILRNISLDVEEGEIIGLVGASGSGKTTLLKSLVGYWKPDKGDVVFRYDAFIKKMDSSAKIKYASIHKQQKLAKNIFGFASQDASVYKKLTAEENLNYFGSLYDLSGKALHTNTKVLLQLMDLKHASNTLAGQLSGGMSRRLDIACALIHDPEILILDEPTSDLDPILRNHIWSLVRRINKKGTTVILASHNLSEVETFCSRIVIIKDGKVVDVATPARLKTKYAESQEVRIQSYPGKYSDIAKSLKKQGKHAYDIKIRGSELVFLSDEPRKVLHDLLHTLEHLKEELIDIKVSRPGLDELFMKITERDNHKR